MIVAEKDRVLRAAYQKAWMSLASDRTLTPDERAHGPNRLREYIHTLVESGATDPIRVADDALGLLRQYEQILRSQARIESPSLTPR